MSYKVAYIPIGVGTYHMETAKEQFDKSVSLLNSVTDACAIPEKVLLTTDEVADFCDGLGEVNLVIIQNITFANAAYASEALKRFSCPVLLWTIKEPVVDGTRLRSNSLTGAYSAANAIRAFRPDSEFEYIFGAPDDVRVKDYIGATIAAAKVNYEIHHMKMAAIGHTPQGFGFGRALDSELLSVFGVTLEAVEARELIEKAKGYSEEECAEYLDKAKTMMGSLDDTPEKNVKDFARLYKAYSEYITEGKIQAVSSRCWPDFFVSYGTPVCSVLSLLNATGVPSSCEADIYGALSMFIGNKFTNGGSSFFGDPVSMDEDEGSITYWHCGMAACNLAREDTGACVGVHPNRKIGPVMDFGCKPSEKATVFRIGRKPDGSFRFFIAEGEVMDKPKQFYGTSIVVKTKTDAKEVVTESIKDGWEPHFVVIYDDVATKLEILARMLGLEICRY